MWAWVGRGLPDAQGGPGLSCGPSRGERCSGGTGRADSYNPSLRSPRDHPIGDAAHPRASAGSRVAGAPWARAAAEAALIRVGRGRSAPPAPRGRRAAARGSARGAGAGRRALSVPGGASLARPSFLSLGRRGAREPCAGAGAPGALLAARRDLGAGGRGRAGAAALGGLGLGAGAPLTEAARRPRPGRRRPAERRPRPGARQPPAATRGRALAPHAGSGIASRWGALGRTTAGPARHRSGQPACGLGVRRLGASISPRCPRAGAGPRYPSAPSHFGIISGRPRSGRPWAFPRYRRVCATRPAGHLPGSTDSRGRRIWRALLIFS